MKIIGIIIVAFLLLLPTVVTAYEYPYGEVYTYEVYYNGEMQGIDAAKPFLKIGEPFTVAIEFTVYQDIFVYVELTELGNDNFEIIEGPTSQLGTYNEGDFCKNNSTLSYEWEVKPTDNWSGGSIPLDIYYSIIEPYNTEPLVNAGFTALYPYISTEYYEGRTTPEEPTETENKQTPAFTLPSALLAIALLATYNRHKK